MKNEFNIESSDIRADINRVRLYCQKCGKICSNLVPLDRLEDWLKNPLCIECKKHGEIRPAQEVDHIKAHKGNYKLFWDHRNWQPLCKTCHSQKTNRERNE